MTRRPRLGDAIRNTRQTGPLFVPFLGPYAIKLAQLPLPRALVEPQRFLPALLDATRLLEPDVVVLLADEATFAESLGGPLVTSAEGLPVVAPGAGRLTPAALPTDVSWGPLARTTLDLLGRLRSGRSVPTALAVAGPTDLLRALTPPAIFEGLRQGDPEAEDALDAAAQISLRLLREAGEVGVDAFIVLDDDLLGVAERSADLAELAWGPLRNLARHYDVPLVLFSAHRSKEPLSASRALGRLTADAHVVPSESLSVLREQGAIVGLGLTREELLSDDLLQRVGRADVGECPVVGTFGAVPLGMRLDTLLALRRQLRSRQR